MVAGRPLIVINRGSASSLASRSCRRAWINVLIPAGTMPATILVAPPGVSESKNARAPRMDVLAAPEPVDWPAWARLPIKLPPNAVVP